MKKVVSIVDEANVAALNKAAVSTRAEAVRILRERYPGFKAAAIRAAMKIIKATYSKPVAIIRVKGARTPLISFGARQTKRGVSVKVRTKKFIKGAFIATMPSGHKGVFWRTGKFGRRGNPKLERIEQLHSLSVPQALETQEVIDSLREYGLARYRIELPREIKFRTERASAR